MSNFRKNIEKIAPSLSKAIAYNSGSFYEIAFRIVTEALKLPNTANDEAINKAIQDNPEYCMLALKKADILFKERAKEISNINNYKDKAENVADNIKKSNTSISAVLAILISLAFFASLAALVLVKIPTNSLNIFNVMIGLLGGAWIAIVNYYFGSSNNN